MASNVTSPPPVPHETLLQMVVDATSNASREVMYTLAVTAVLVLLYLNGSGPKSALPFINWDKSEWTYSKARARYRDNAKALIAAGFRKFSGPFNLMTATGPVTMLPPEYIDAINSEPKLDFAKFVQDDSFGHLESFSNFRFANELAEVVHKSLTRSLPKFTKPLSDEMASCLDDTWAGSEEWRTVRPYGDVLNWVARLSCLIFMGEEMARNDEWLRISKDCTINIFQAIGDIKRYFPGPLAYIGERFHPRCRKIRADYRACYEILRPILAKRKEEIEAAENEGRKPNLPDDSIEWFRHAAGGHDYNYIPLQMSLSVASIHTTSDLLTQALLNLGSHPEYFESLRKEAVEVLSKHGWKKVALTELRLLDSFFKETQRLKPIVMATMLRTALADVELPGGIKLRSGERCAVSSHNMWEEKSYADPSRFDPFRFVERRKLPGMENRSLLVATSQDHTGFGHGRHACPGRFFAANEVKIAMVHVLLKYDVRIVEPERAGWIEDGQNMLANPLAKLQVRRRKEEIDLKDLVVE